jgi:hypothetical protein
LLIFSSVESGNLGRRGGRNEQRASFPAFLPSKIVLSLCRLRIRRFFPFARVFGGHAGLFFLSADGFFPSVRRFYSSADVSGRGVCLFFSHADVFFLPVGVFGGPADVFFPRACVFDPSADVFFSFADVFF